MITMLSQPTLTADDLLALPDSKHFELVDGQLVEKNVSVLSSLVELRIGAKISLFCEQHRLGQVWPSSMGFKCYPGDPNKIRRPDVSFIKAERFQTEMLQDGFLTLPPDLAVEVVSPNDLALEITEKVEEYLEAGVALVWVVEPENRVLDIYRKDGTLARLRETDELSGEDVLPNFRCPVAELFPS